MSSDFKKLISITIISFLIFSFIIFVLNSEQKEEAVLDNNLPISKDTLHAAQGNVSVGATILAKNNNILDVELFIDQDDEDESGSKKDIGDLGLKRNIILSNQTQVLETFYPEDYYEGKNYHRKIIEKDFSSLKVGDFIGIEFFGDWRKQKNITATAILKTTGVDKETFDKIKD